jgi:predicted HicB family RNase H-like nuclease
LNNLLEYKGYLGTVEYSAEDNLLYGKIIGISSLILYEGSSLRMLKKDFKDGVNNYLLFCKTKKITPEKPIDGFLNVQISPALNAQLFSYSAKHNQSPDQTVEEALRNYITA